MSPHFLPSLWEFGDVAALAAREEQRLKGPDPSSPSEGSPAMLGEGNYTLLPQPPPAEDLQLRDQHRARSPASLGGGDGERPL